LGREYGEHTRWRVLQPIFLSQAAPPPPDFRYGELGVKKEGFKPKTKQDAKRGGQKVTEGPKVRRNRRLSRPLNKGGPAPPNLDCRTWVGSNSKDWAKKGGVEKRGGGKKFTSPHKTPEWSQRWSESVGFFRGWGRKTVGEEKKKQAEETKNVKPVFTGRTETNTNHHNKQIKREIKVAHHCHWLFLLKSSRQADTPPR